YIAAYFCSDSVTVPVSLFHLLFRSTVVVSFAILVFFFFYWYGDRRDLHSFPTRRSSDLGSGMAAAAGAGRRRPQGARAPWGRRRSEEHTSELQSLAYLVCRLLLEKKKKN